MAFTTLSTSLADVGEPVKKELMLGLINNSSDHETRISQLETSVNTTVPLEFSLYGAYSRLAVPSEGIFFQRIPFDMTLVGGILQIFDAGTSGTTEIDIQISTDGGSSFGTIFSTKPSVLFSAGDFALSSNAVFSVTLPDLGDILRLDLTSRQSAANSFTFALSFEPR